ncbi:unnamed protein product [Phyllotreta striolata]|uniref:Uncharacterized protein n=1 Tax=Phyllotreta striolata TaxID=444603 RepID=A0A9P0E0P1_PHYSR|nr:unnamed protein product [Phyllotreta striolata]
MIKIGPDIMKMNKPIILPSFEELLGLLFFKCISCLNRLTLKNRK